MVPPEPHLVVVATMAKLISDLVGAKRGRETGEKIRRQLGQLLHQEFNLSLELREANENLEGLLGDVLEAVQGNSENLGALHTRLDQAVMEIKESISANMRPLSTPSAVVRPQPLSDIQRGLAWLYARLSTTRLKTYPIPSDLKLAREARIDQAENAVAAVRLAQQKGLLELDNPRWPAQVGGNLGFTNQGRLEAKQALRQAVLLRLHDEADFNGEGKFEEGGWTKHFGFGGSYLLEFMKSNLEQEGLIELSQPYEHGYHAHRLIGG